MIAPGLGDIFIARAVMKKYSFMIFQARDGAARTGVNFPHGAIFRTLPLWPVGNRAATVKAMRCPKAFAATGADILLGKPPSDVGVHCLTDRQFGGPAINS